VPLTSWAIDDLRRHYEIDLRGGNVKQWREALDPGAIACAPQERSIASQEIRT